MGGSTTTVVVARTIRPGRAREAERWIGRLLRAVAAAPGFLGSTAHEPSVAHPDEWLVVYSFESAAALEAWLSSPERQTLIASGAGLFADEVREQRLADRVAADTVTLVSSVTLRPGVEATYRGLYDEGVQAAGDSGGLVRAELLPALAGVQPETVALLTFASRDDLDRWVASAARQDVLARMEPLLAGARTLNVVGGFAGWFTAGPVKPKRWKQALTVFVCLVPVSLVATLVRIDLLPHALCPWPSSWDQPRTSSCSPGSSCPSSPDDSSHGSFAEHRDDATCSTPSRQSGRPRAISTEQVHQVVG
jgi:hypothetical protein